MYAKGIMLRTAQCSGCTLEKQYSFLLASRYPGSASDEHRSTG